MSGIALFLPFPPSVNTYWRSILMVPKGQKAHSGHVRVLVSDKGRKYRDEVAAEMAKQLRGHDKILGPLGVHIFARPPDRRRRDLDNLPKAVFDACTHAGVWGDDSQVQRMTVEWCGEAAKSLTWATTYEMSPGMIVLEICP